MSLDKIKIGGHRGLGCTDHHKYGTLRDIKSLPAENTLESIRAAYEGGADYIETDAVMSGDGVLFTIHNVVPKDHFFGAMPHDQLNKMNFADIQKYKTGHLQKGVLSKFSDILEVVAQHSPKTLPWDINIEIKGVQASVQPYEKK